MTEIPKSILLVAFAMANESRAKRSTRRLYRKAINMAGMYVVHDSCDRAIDRACVALAVTIGPDVAQSVNEAYCRSWGNANVDGHTFAKSLSRIISTAPETTHDST